MSSKNKKYRQKEVAHTAQPTKGTSKTGPSRVSLLERSQRFLPHNQEDDMAKLRWIVIFVVILLAIEFTVIAVAMASSGPSSLNKNSGQMIPLNGGSGGVCNTNTGNSTTLMDPQSPAASLQYSPGTQNSTGNLGASNDALQASPQVNQCVN